jgi:arsenite methyltransferase
MDKRAAIERSLGAWARGDATTKTESRMHRILIVFLAVMLGGACGPASNRSLVPPGESGLDDNEKAAHKHHGANKHGEVGAHHTFADAQAWTNVFDDPARDEWQRPDEVLRALELIPTMTVADIGAGTGYFAVRLARAVPAGEVIATDLEPDMVRYLNERAQREQLPNLRAIHSTHATSGLAAASVDRILMVNVWHHIADRVDYARDLAAALRLGGKLFIVEFSLTAHRGPPASMRVTPEQVIAELQNAGLVAVLLPTALPDQYIVEAHRSP